MSVGRIGSPVNIGAIVYRDADEKVRERIEKEWSEKAARHLHISDGVSVVAFHGNLPVGLISAYPKRLPYPLLETFDWYIDVLEVQPDYRRMGIATHLIHIVSERAKERGAYQIRAWSSEDKIEVMSMWKGLGFGLCPAVTYPQGQDNEVRGYFVAKVL